MPADLISLFFFFNDTATTEIYTLSLHDALPISPSSHLVGPRGARRSATNRLWCRSKRKPHFRCPRRGFSRIDRKSTRLNSSHLVISYAVFCLKKKKKTITDIEIRLTCITTTLLY